MNKQLLIFEGLRGRKSLTLDAIEQFAKLFGYTVHKAKAGDMPDGLMGDILSADEALMAAGLPRDAGQ